MLINEIPPVVWRLDHVIKAFRQGKRVVASILLDDALRQQTQAVEAARIEYEKQKRDHATLMSFIEDIEDDERYFSTILKRAGFPGWIDSSDRKPTRLFAGNLPIGTVMILGGDRFEKMISGFPCDTWTRTSKFDRKEFVTYFSNLAIQAIIDAEAADFILPEGGAT